MNTHDCAKHTHAGPLWDTHTYTHARYTLRVLLESFSTQNHLTVFPLSVKASLKPHFPSNHFWIPNQKSSLPPRLTKPPTGSLLPALLWLALGLRHPGTPSALLLAWKLCAGRDQAPQLSAGAPQVWPAFSHSTVGLFLVGWVDVIFLLGCCTMRHLASGIFICFPLSAGCCCFPLGLPSF